MILYVLNKLVYEITVKVYLINLESDFINFIKIEYCIYLVGCISHLKKSNLAHSIIFKFWPIFCSEKALKGCPINYWYPVHNSSIDLYHNIYSMKLYLWYVHVSKQWWYNHKIIFNCFIEGRSPGWTLKWFDECAWYSVKYCNRESGYHFHTGYFQNWQHFLKWPRPKPYEVFWSLDCILIQSIKVVIWSWMNSYHSRMDGLAVTDFPSQTLRLLTLL